MTPRRTALVLILFAGALGVGGCGKQAELARPRPMFGAAPTQPTAETATRDAMARRALADASPHADPRAPESLDELRQLRGKPGAKGSRITSYEATDPSAPHPPGSPEELPPPSSTDAADPPAAAPQQ